MQSLPASCRLPVTLPTGGGFTRAYGSYEEMLDDEEVELVYIATPHSHHLNMHV